MRRRIALVCLLAGALGACADSAPPRLAYAPPREQPSQASSAYVAQPADLIWTQLLDRLHQSSLHVNLADPERGIIVATYSGEPEPYVNCGWILLYGEGELEQIPASSAASFGRVVQGRPLELDRDLTLDGRLVVEVSPDRSDAIVKASSNYVLTKTVVAENRSGRPVGRAREVVSFSTGERGQFSKGTICQPSGAFESTVMDALPSVTRVVQPAQRAGPAPTRRATIVPTDVARVPPQEEVSDCSGPEQVYCHLLEITDPYRRANRERDLGLEVDAIEGGSSLLTGGDLGLDISLPNYDAYLAVSYFLTDGTVHHVFSGSGQRWPAGAREFVGDIGLGVGERQSVEMVVALASDVPMFASPRPPSEPAADYLTDLRRRLAEMTGGDSPTRIAATVVVIAPADDRSASSVSRS